MPVASGLTGAATPGPGPVEPGAAEARAEAEARREPTEAAGAEVVGGAAEAQRDQCARVVVDLPAPVGRERVAAAVRAGRGQAGRPAQPRRGPMAGVRGGRPVGGRGARMTHGPRAAPIPARGRHTALARSRPRRVEVTGISPQVPASLLAGGVWAHKGKRRSRGRAAGQGPEVFEGQSRLHPRRCGRGEVRHQSRDPGPDSGVDAPGTEMIARGDWGGVGDRDLDGKILFLRRLNSLLA